MSGDFYYSKKIFFFSEFSDVTPPPSISGSQWREKERKDPPLQPWGRNF